MDAVLTVLAIAVAAVFAALGMACGVNAVTRGEPVRITRAGASRFFREAAAHLLTGPLLLSGFGQPPPRPADLPSTSPDRVPVILVPGYALNRATFFFLATYLRRRGWRWVWPVDNRPFSSPVMVFARGLSEKVDELRRVTGAEKVDIVGHSMGGLVAAWYVSHMGGAPFVRRLVTLGTPWRGTLMHVWGRRREARDLAPTSEVIALIGSPPVPTTAIWSRSDELVIPVENALGEGIETIEVFQLGHLEMLYSARVFRLVADLLDAAEPPAVPPDPAALPDPAPTTP